MENQKDIQQNGVERNTATQQADDRNIPRQGQQNNPNPKEQGHNINGPTSRENDKADSRGTQVGVTKDVSSADMAQES